MASQRAPPRRPVHPATQGTIQNLRESSRSPSLRSRTMKTHSMPIAPAAMQIFAASNTAQPSAQTQQQPNPTSSINSRRSPPASVQRLLPTPPHPPPVNTEDITPELPGSPSLPSQHPHNQPNQPNQPNPHYPRPIHRGAVPFISKFQNLEQDNWEVTEELLAEIERADLQQSQAQANQSTNYSTAYLQNQQPNSPPKDPVVERLRATERSSPKEPDMNPQRRQQTARESPKQPPSQSPERRVSPSPYQGGLVPSEQSSGYIQYTREPPAALRRPTNAPPAPVPVDSRPLVASLATQTPPSQTITARTPDRSLPVQEELEDEPTKNGTGTGTGTRQTWHAQEINDGQHVRHTGASPTPSSDLNPDGEYADHDHHHNGRSSRNGHREESSLPLQQDSVAAQQRYPDREREHVEEEDVAFTPRSTTAELPEHSPSKYYSPPHNAVRPVQSQPPRRQTRNGPTDQLGLRSFDPADFEGDTSMLVMGSEMPPQYTEPRRQQQAPLPSPSAHYPNSQYVEQSQAQYRQPKIHPDDVQQYDSSYIQSYFQSPRPDAPVPPTPHSQTAAPSPSPLLSGHYQDNSKDLAPFSPVVPVGSPYPYPFNHVRRTQTFSGPNRAHVPTSFDTAELTNIQQQLTRQWEVYARNHQYGNVSDSTFSPSSTPFEGGGFTPWAFLHTSRTLGRPQDTTSMRSSPSHEPLEPPMPPPTLGVKKSHRPTVLRRHQSNRKPPPRVESTQPRDTSPEPSSSGEETAGDERFGNAEDGNWSGGTIAPIPIAVTDNKDEWVDEENDEDDLLELEYHQNYVNNVEKRRRRWEVGWEAVTQAIQNLDRQTDATIVLMAAPSHSTKLYSATSRSVRRQSGAATSAVAMKEMRSAFSRIATQRRRSRSHKSSLVDRFLFSSSSSGDGSDGSTESREVDLKRALEAALGSLASLGGIYEQREARWREEMRRIAEDRERVELLLKQVLGDHHTSASSTLSVASPVVSSHS
ncbi:hypothetical protein H2248_005704 [Termitomyces sp. 'cryptogamus']|nr:hypothetical protein H2248_005704 [Termitomyces sp. 'cryptogamus']